jgi:UDP-N-acetyl-D-galactosamine dehydrogenase
VAEAAKVIENTQRDLNIALVNELSMIFDRLGIDTRDVLAAAGTKWNFQPFHPGLVGGHCIGVDPFYLTHKAEQTGYHPQVILAGRRVNDGMSVHVAQRVLRELLRRGQGGQPVVTILGVTFKANVPDTRNTKVVDLARELHGSGVTVQLHDPHADAGEFAHEYGLDLTADGALAPADAVILATGHSLYRGWGWAEISALLRGGTGMVADLTGSLDRQTAPQGVKLWRL